MSRRPRWRRRSSPRTWRSATWSIPTRRRGRAARFRTGAIRRPSRSTRFSGWYPSSSFRSWGAGHGTHWTRPRHRHRVEPVPERQSMASPEGLLTDLVGGTISHYRILSRLGAGGMGVVYRARDERLGRDLALKVLPAESMADPTARARLLREAQMASSLNHPHIAHIYEVGEDREHLFIAMELVEGRPLKDSIPPAGMPPDALLEYGSQIANALAYAHERGIVHRDLKSVNVMITPEGRVKVLDFGLAKRLDEPDQPETPRDLSLTVTGMVVGTPHYLPPEALLGGKADVRGDVWAL